MEGNSDNGPQSEIKIPKLFNSEWQTRAERTYEDFRKAFPNRDVRYFGNGSSAIVYQDIAQPSNLYKVYLRWGNPDDRFDPDLIRYSRSEASKIFLAQQNGFGPGLVEYVEPAMSDAEQELFENRRYGRHDYLIDSSLVSDEVNILPNVSIPKSKRRSSVPIIVMGMIDVDPDGIRRLSEEQAKLESEIRRIARALTCADFRPGDTELVVTTAGRLDFVDFGGMHYLNNGRFKNTDIDPEIEANVRERVRRLGKF